MRVNGDPSGLAGLALPATPQLTTDQKLLSAIAQGIGRVTQGLNTLTGTMLLEGAFLPRQIAVGTAATRIFTGQYPKGYILANIQQSPKSTLVSQSAISASGTQSDSLNVYDNRSLHLWLDCTLTSANSQLQIVLQSQDPVSGNWADVTEAFSAYSTSTQYAFLDNFGVADKLRVRWIITNGAGAGTWTFTVSYMLKQGAVIFLGGPGVTTTSGFGLVSGQYLHVVSRPNTELFAIARQPVTLTMLEN
jgi:hypothetical protein